MKGKLPDGEARDRLILWLRRRMTQYGITHEALAASLQQDRDRAPRYRDAHGNEWNGEGSFPQWLAAARHAGVSPEFFRIEPGAAAPRERSLSGKASPFA